jgi:hypothetical protein
MISHSHFFLQEEWDAQESSQVAASFLNCLCITERQFLVFHCGKRKAIQQQWSFIGEPVCLFLYCSMSQDPQRERLRNNSLINGSESDYIRL